MRPSGAIADAGFGDTAPVLPRRICDGSSEFRLLFQVPVYLGATEPGSQVVWENGTSYLFVRGDCRYWVFTSQTVDATAETREGSLSPDAEAKLHDELRYDEWPNLVGTYGDPSVHDVYPATLSDLTNKIACLATCTVGDPAKSPPSMAALFAATGTWVSTLYAQGQPLTGPVRALAAARMFPDWQYEILPWTLAVPLASFVWDPATTPAVRGQGRLITDADAEILRQWRNNQHAEMYHPAWEGAFIPVSEDGSWPFFGLFVRDVLPFEDENGLVPFGPFAQ